MEKVVWSPQMIKVAEWNIHMMANVVEKFPYIIEETLEIKNYFYDIIVLVEYKQNIEFEKKLQNIGYRVFTNSPLKKKNEVLIAIKEDLINEVVEVNKNIPLNVGEIKPDFLHVKIKRNGKIFSVIGMRNLFGVDYHLHMEAIKRYLTKIVDEDIIVVGDFNVISSNIEKFLPANFRTYQPIHNRSFYNTENFINNYSYIFTEEHIIKSMNKLDYCISNKGITNLSYSWDFINHCNVYPEKSTIERNVTKWNIPVGYPDHALFTFVVDI